MHTLGIMRTFRTKNFTVRVTAEEEYDVDLSWDDDGSTREGLENGTLIAFCAKAAVYYRGRERLQAITSETASIRALTISWTTKSVENRIRNMPRRVSPAAVGATFAT